ncbi:reverse transcriptase [Teladorsagia circumcincta]|uniref:Reverse transcriptase n=1 Tax=Teladorsagia circumcincta TaxID=45464 RepID=A0A2G9UVK2_TELCI|nr:reverse transcriptase [Teladorsagia circumcincta]
MASFFQAGKNDRWLEHFRDILNQPNPPKTYCFDDMEQIEELDVSTGRIVKEETVTAECLRNRKSHGTDEIAEGRRQYNGEKTCEAIQSLLEPKRSPGRLEERRHRQTTQKKGNLSDCGNCRGITLLSVPGKTFCVVLLRRLRAERLREEQAGFRSGRPCCEQTFTLRNIIEQCVKYCQPIVINFVDFEKAFDSIHRESLWAILKKVWCTATFIRIIKNLYLNSSCCIATGVRQGCILSPILFNRFRHEGNDGEARTGISWSEQKRLTDLDFADDIALLAEDENELQQITTCLNNEANMIGLRISADKSKVIRVGFDRTQLSINVDDTTLETVDSFTYLGSTVTYNSDAERDVRIRIAKAAAVFQRLQPI